MATLTPIFSKMPDAGTPIQNNFEAINSELITGGPIAKAQAIITADGVTGTIYFERQGKTVTARGNVSVTKAFSDVILPLAKIPVGFRNTNKDADSCTIASTSHRVQGSWVTVNGSGEIKLTTDNSTTTDSGSWKLQWYTDDDFPA